MAESLKGLTGVKKDIEKTHEDLEHVKGLLHGRYLRDSLPFLAIPVTGGPQPQGTITEIRFNGNAKTPAEKIKAELLSRDGDPIDLRKINAEVKTLMHTEWFSDVQAYYVAFRRREDHLVLRSP